MNTVHQLIPQASSRGHIVEVPEIKTNQRHSFKESEQNKRLEQLLGVYCKKIKINRRPLQDCFRWKRSCAASHDFIPRRIKKKAVGTDHGSSMLATLDAAASRLLPRFHPRRSSRRHVPSNSSALFSTPMMLFARVVCSDELVMGFFTTRGIHGTP